MAEVLESRTVIGQNISKVLIQPIKDDYQNMYQHHTTYFFHDTSAPYEYAQIIQYVWANFINSEKKKKIYNYQYHKEF